MFFYRNLSQKLLVNYELSANVEFYYTYLFYTEIEKLVL